MINIKRNLILSLEKRKKDGFLIENNVPIRLRVIFNGNRIDIQTGYRIDFSKWDNIKGKVKNGCFNKYGQSSDIINSKSQELEIVIQNLFRLSENSNRIPSKNDIKDVVKSFRQQNKNNSVKANSIQLFNVFDNFVKENSRLNNWSESTNKKFSTFKKHLEDFKPDLTFEDFDQIGLTDYLVFLRIQKEMRNSTIKKQLGFLKWFLKWSYENNHHTNETYKRFKPKIKSSNSVIIFLTEEDKKKILDVDISKTKEYLQRVRDVLIFMCYTGLRYSDVFNLKRSDIKENHFEITTIKTSDNLIIEFNKHSRAIIEKYKSIPYKNNKALPVISNQKMNVYIKELGELAKINDTIRQTYYIGNKRIDTIYPKYELLSTHVGRRTFICSALSVGIPVQVVMKWSGHADYKSMKPYIDVSDKTKQIAMSKFDML